MTRRTSPEDHKSQLRLLQIEVAKLLRYFIACGDTILGIVEGRDAVGKAGAIKPIVAHLSPRYAGKKQNAFSPTPK